MHPITVIYKAVIQAPNVFLLIVGRQYGVRAKRGTAN